MLSRKKDKALTEKVLAVLKKPETKSGKGKKALVAATLVGAAGAVFFKNTEKADHS